jgi:hypothetical protein
MRLKKIIWSSTIVLTLVVIGCQDVEQCLSDGDCGICGHCDYGSCRDRICDNPPDDRCVEQNQIWSYQPSGTCQPDTGKCDYPYDVVNCSMGCDPETLTCKGCQNECASGARECSNDRQRSCITGGDGCLSWSDYQDCQCGCLDQSECKDDSACAGGCTQAGWIFEKIAEQVTSDPAGIVVDHDDVVHVVYYLSASDKLQYTTRLSADQWSTSELGSGRAERAIAVDGQNNLFVAAIDNSQQLHIYKKPAQGEWQSQLLDIDATSAPAMKIYNDQVSVMYWSDQQDLVRQTNGSIDQAWSSVDLVDFAAISLRTKGSLDFDFQDNGWFSALFRLIENNGYEYVEHMHQTGETQVEQTMLSDYYSDDKLYPAIVVDNQNGLHVVYIQDELTGSFELLYRSKTAGGEWQYEVVAEGLPNSPVTLFYDTAEYITLGYSSPTRPVLKYKMVGSDSFQTIIPDMGQESSLVATYVDQDGRAHLLLYANTELYYASGCLTR